MVVCEHVDEFMRQPTGPHSIKKAAQLRSARLIISIYVQNHTPWSSNVTLFMHDTIVLSMSFLLTNLCIRLKIILFNSELIIKWSKHVLPELVLAPSLCACPFKKISLLASSFYGKWTWDSMGQLLSVQCLYALFHRGRAENVYRQSCPSCSRQHF